MERVVGIDVLNAAFFELGTPKETVVVQTYDRVKLRLKLAARVQAQCQLIFDCSFIFISLPIKPHGHISASIRKYRLFKQTLRLTISVNTGGISREMIRGRPHLGYSGHSSENRSRLE